MTTDGRRRSVVDSTMPFLIDIPTRFDVVVDAMSHLVATRGTAALTLRAIGAEARISPPSLIHSYGGRERLVHLFLHRVCRDRLFRMDTRMDRGMASCFPVEELDLRTEIVWRAMREAAREDDELAEVCARARLEERHVLHARTMLDLSESQLDALQALVDGLTQALVHPIRPTPLARVHAAFDLVLPRILDGASTRTVAMPPLPDPPQLPLSLRLRQA